jgi:hypothetical protein
MDRWIDLFFNRLISQLRYIFTLYNKIHAWQIVAFTVFIECLLNIE